MKLFVSNYSGSLNCCDYDIKYVNIPELKKFMEKGNKFLLNTNQSFNNIQEEIGKYDIPYNYLSCNDGNLLLDRKDNVLYMSNMNDDLDYDLQIISHDYPEIKIDRFYYNDNIVEYCFTVDEYGEIIKALLNWLCQKYAINYRVINNKDHFNIYLFNRGISKLSSINIIRDIEGINNKDIYIVGSTINDLDMLGEYNCYATLWANSEVKNICKKECLGVKSLLKKINRR